MKPNQLMLYFCKRCAVRVRATSEMGAEKNVNDFCKAKDLTKK